MRLVQDHSSPDVASTSVAPKLPATWQASSPPSRSKPQHFVWFTPSLALLLGGYLFFSKSFAYLRVPGTPVYVGEVVLSIGLIEALLINSPWRHLLKTSPALKALLVFVAICGVRLTADFSTYRLDAVRDSSVWYYGAFAFIVAAAVVREPTFVPRLLGWYRRALPWFFIWAPVAVVAAGMQAFPTIVVPGSSTPITSFKLGDFTVQVAVAVAFLWLDLDRLTWGPALRRPVITRLSVLGLVTLGICGSQNRGGFLAAVVLLTITLAYSPPGRRTRLVLSSIGGVLLVLVVVLLLDLRIQGGRRDISVQQVGTNIASVLGSGGNEDLVGTVEWRQNYWDQVLTDLRTTDSGIAGLGFGPILPERYESGSLQEGPPLRSAHNSHLSILARVGFIGFTAWLMLWLIWCYQLARWIHVRNGGARASSEAALGVWLLSAVIGLLINAFFDPSLEGPQAAVWLYTFAGVGAALARGIGGRVSPMTTRA